MSKEGDVDAPTGATAATGPTRREEFLREEVGVEKLADAEEGPVR